LKTLTIEVPNLLGDAIYSSFVIQQIIQAHPDDLFEIVLSEPTWCAAIYSYIPGVRNVRPKRPGEVCSKRIDLSRAFAKDVSQYGGEKPFWHVISEDLGYNSEAMTKPPIALSSIPVTSVVGRVVLSPFSASCASRQGQPANKMLSAAHWQCVFDLVLDMWHNGQVGEPLFIGAPGEHVLRDVPPAFEMLGEPLPHVMAVLQQAQCIIGVDTGTIRLANMLGTPAFFTTPLGLGKMFLPDWGGYTRHETGYPQAYTPTQFRDSVESFLLTAPLDARRGSP
jgi:hypothetical protein